MPGVVQHRALLLLALVGVLYAAVSRFPMHVTAGSSSVTRAYDGVGCGDVREISSDIAGPTGKAMTLCLLNYERARAGLAPLVENQLLDVAAERHSDDMVTRRFFEHVNPDGTTPQARIDATGYVATRGTGENIAWGDGGLASPAAIVDGWMHSPGHRENILRPQYREIGIGVRLGGRPKPSQGELKAATYTTDFGG